MGCCASKPREEPLLGPPRDVSTTDVRALDGKLMPGGCKLWPFVASCPASYPYRAYTRVVETDDHVFAALFTGVGGHQAAEHCISNCYEVLSKALQQAEPDRALRQTVQQLEASYFALQNLSDQIKALVGAVGTLLYVHTPSNQVYVANIGSAAPFLTRSTGSFSSIKVTAQLLTSDAKHRHPLSWHHAVLTGEDHPHGPSTAAAAAPAGGGGQGPTDARCIGMGYGKVPALAAAWAKALGDTPRGLPPLPFIRTDCEVTVSPLSPGDEALVLGSADLVGLVPPREVATLVHYFGAGVLQMLQDTYLPDRPAVVLPVAVMSQGDPSAQSGTPSIQPGGLVLAHGRGKALQRYNTATRARLGHGQLTALPLEEASAPGQDLAPPEEGSGGASQASSKRAVHGDMAAVVICLQWLRSGGGAETASGGGSSHALVAKLARSPRAAYRWQLVRALVRFQVARRRQLLGSWWEAVEQVSRSAETAARQREVEAWRRSGTAVQVSRTGQLSAAAAHTGTTSSNSSSSSPWHGKYTSSSAQKAPPTARDALAGSTAAAAAASAGSSSGWGGSPAQGTSSSGGGGGHKGSHHGLRRTGPTAAGGGHGVSGCSSGRSTPVGAASSAASTPVAGSGLRRGPGAGAMGEGYHPAAGAEGWEAEPATPVPAAAAYAGEALRQREVVLEGVHGCASSAVAGSSGRMQEDESEGGYAEEQEEAGGTGLPDRSPDASKGRLRDVPGATIGKQAAAAGRGAASSGSSPAAASRLGSTAAAGGGSKVGSSGSPVKRPGVGAAGRRAGGLAGGTASTGAGGSPTKASRISLRRQH